MNMKKNSIDDDIKLYTGDKIAGIIQTNRPFKPSYYAFLLINKGQIKVRYKLTQHTLYRYDVLLINPQVIYEFTSIPEHNEMLLIVIKKDFKLRIPTRFSKLDTIHYFETSSVVHLTFSPTDFLNIWQLVKIIESKITCSKGKFTTDLRHTLLASVFYILIEKVETKQNDIKKRSEKLTVEFIDLLQIHFREHHIIEFYAKRLNVSSKHLSETLKKITGHTARELINLALIREAKMLLVNRELKINTISEILNFSDQFSFSKFFKRITNCSPKQYVDQSGHNN